MLQVVHTVLEEQVVHPIINDEQGEHVVTLIVYPLLQVVQTVVEEHVAQLSR